MKAKEQLETLPEYDAMLVKDLKVPQWPAADRQRGADGSGLGFAAPSTERASSQRNASPDHPGAFAFGITSNAVRCSSPMMRLRPVALRRGLSASG